MMSIGSLTRARTRTSRIGMLVAVVALVGLAAMSGSVAADSSVDQSSVKLNESLTVTVESSDLPIAGIESGNEIYIQAVVDGEQIAAGSSSPLTYDGPGQYTWDHFSVDADNVGSNMSIRILNTVTTAASDSIGTVQVKRADDPIIRVNKQDATVVDAPAPYAGENAEIEVFLGDTVLDEGGISVSVDGVGYSDVDDRPSTYTVSLTPEDIGDSAGDAADYTIVNERDNQQLETGQLELIDPELVSTGNITELNGASEINVTVDTDDVDVSRGIRAQRYPPLQDPETNVSNYEISVWTVVGDDATGFSSVINVSETNTTTIAISDPNVDTASLTVPSAVESISIDNETVYESDDDGAMLIGATPAESGGAWLVIGAVVVAFVVFRD